MLPDRFIIHLMRSWWDPLNSLYWYFHKPWPPKPSVWLCMMSNLTKVHVIIYSPLRAYTTNLWIFEKSFFFFEQFDDWKNCFLKDLKSFLSVQRLLHWLPFFWIRPCVLTADNNWSVLTTSPSSLLVGWPKLATTVQNLLHLAVLVTLPPVPLLPLSDWISQETSLSLALLRCLTLLRWISEEILTPLGSRSALKMLPNRDILCWTK